jgi:hypothetical protein
VVSEKNFTRLNNWLRSEGFTVEEVPYAEISKQEGPYVVPHCTQEKVAPSPQGEL